jgi:hypothetical protein
MSRMMFQDFPKETRAFYSRIVYKGMLNIVAVRRGLFDQIFCESTDETVFYRFHALMDSIKQELLGNSEIIRYPADKSEIIVFPKVIKPPTPDEL